MFEDPDISDMESAENSASRPDDSPNEADYRKVRARQVGRLMLSYRLERKGRGKGGRLSQKGLLALMGRVKGGYEDYSHSTVGRWESGEILPTKERLGVFGAALNLDRAEIHGLIALAGLGDGEGNYAEVAATGSRKVPATAPEASTEADNPPSHGDEGRSYSGDVIRFLLSKFLLPGLGIAGAGYLLASVGWSADWMLSMYIVVVVCAVLAHHFLRPRRATGHRDFLFVSLFVLLSTPMLQAPLMRMDHFGFYAIDGFGGTPIPYVLAMLVNLVLAFIAGFMYDLLYMWQDSRGAVSPYRRAAWVTIPPLAFVYICMLFISCAGTWLYLLEALPVLGGVLMAILILRDDSVRLTELDKRFMLQVAVAITIGLTVMSLLGMVVIYWDPSLQFIPDHTLVRSWEIDFNDLGYSYEEFVDRSRISTIWSSLAATLYMVVVVGGSLVVTILKKDTGDSADTAPSPAVLPAATASRKRRSKRSRLDARYRPGLLAGHRILQPARSSAGISPY